MAEPVGFAVAEESRIGMEGASVLSNFNGWMIAEQRRIYLLCLRMLRSGDEADSATQDAFFKAYRALCENGGVDVEDAQKWLTRIAVNTCLDRLRSRRWQFWRKRSSAVDEVVLFRLARASTPEPDAAVFAKEIEGRLSNALDRLSDRQRTVFILRHDENKSLEEIGQILDLDTGTVKSHLARALVKLREELRDLYEH